LQICLNLICLTNIKSHIPAIHIIGNAIFTKENFNPKFPNTISVNGAPIFVHKIIPTALFKPIIHAPTKDKTIKDTTLLLCSTDVTKSPVDIDLIKLLVVFFNKFLKFLVTK